MNYDKHVYIFYYYSQKVQMKLQVADVFLDKFQLKLDEVKALRGNRDGSLSQVSDLFKFMKSKI